MTSSLQKASFESVAPSGVRAEIINAIADMALAARAGTLLRAYQREWTWVDQENYRDLVDADTFNAAFHDIEREFDKLAESLAQGAGPSMAPTWQQVVTLAEGAPEVTLSHSLGTTDLLIDVQAGLKVSAEQRVRALVAPLTSIADAPAGQQVFWTNIGLGFIYGFVLVGDDRITLGRADLAGVAGVPYLEFFAGELTLRVRAWKLG
jgi:hypothetical protein